jgi:hypothetical protein
MLEEKIALVILPTGRAHNPRLLAIKFFVTSPLTHPVRQAPFNTSL